MLAPAHIEVEKARPHGPKLLADATQSVRLHWAACLSSAAEQPKLAEHLACGDVNAVLAAFGAPMVRFANAWLQGFIAAGNRSAQEFNRKLVRKAPTVELSFDILDPVAVRLMQANKLRLVQDFTTQQRAVTRAALVAGLRNGEGPAAMARRFRNSIGLDVRQQRHLEAFEAAQRGAVHEQMLLPEDERGVVSTDRDIQRLVDRKADQSRAERALRIARTESTRIVGLAQDQALRQSIRSVGQSAHLTGKQWNCTHDARSRDTHVDADGQRRRLDEPFDVGGEQIDKPGDGSARNAVNCRCVETFEFFASKLELAEWIAGSG